MTNILAILSKQAGKPRANIKGRKDGINAPVLYIGLVQIKPCYVCAPACQRLLFCAYVKAP
jgi:hypothetical protein